METYRTRMGQLPEIDHVAGDELDYSADFSAWLAQAGADTITDHQVEVVGAAKVRDQVLGGVVTAWVQGGAVGTPATVTFTITTRTGRRASKSVRLLVVAQAVVR